MRARAAQPSHELGTCSARRVPVLDYELTLPQVFAWLAGCFSALLLAGCGASLPAPRLAEHPQESYVDVPYPPSAALAEIVPPRPKSGNVIWIDGDWIFRGKFYAWQRGGWFTPPSNSRYAPSRIVYLPDGRFLFAPGTWYDAQNQPLPLPDATTPATTPPNEITSEFQTGR